MVAFTPLEDFARFADRLHRQEGFIYFGAPGDNGERGDYDIVTALPERQIRCHADSLSPMPLPAAIETLKSALEPAPRLSPDQLTSLPFIPPFIGGLAGHIGYETGYYLDPTTTALRAKDDGDLLSVGLYTWAAVKENRTGRSALFWHPRCTTATREHIRSMATARISPADNFRITRPFAPDQTAEQYQSRVSRILDYLLAGDAYQVNLSQRFEGGYEGDPWHAFLQLTAAHDAAFSAYYNSGHSQILSLSPERFILADKGRVITAPIKGTRARGATRDEDARLREQLVNSEKDRAENLMIVDLLRNDLGRQCVTGSVHVDELFRVESHPNVHHLVSTISGRLRPDLTPLDLLLSAFPGGSITGAPKRRAMEIIHELEPHQRGPYCGSIFYISHHGRMDSNIAIRTLRCSEGLIECWGGGGVVADSDPQEEYEESCVKVKRLMEIVESLH
ncbi:aminodeoxychorismate synthase component I [Mangrovitalea sediminis]|uniref:aminodeoxychorismate synthase component I n=1 Tax=Mangrovitalea sediminis TaxID=1982043 RepID=UPI001304212B|nr:aminodeoxychorismate synthase component I [Mangrovitalea sediminis]